MRLYFIRHGQSELNLKGILAGQTDTPLTDEGREQAKEAAVKLEGIKFDAVFSSDLSRAHETQKIMLPDYTAVTTPLVREFDMVELVGNTMDEIIKRYGEHTIKQAFNTHDFKQFGGESKEDVKIRLKQFLSDVIDKDYENVAVFCHSGLCKTMLTLAAGCDWMNSYCDNCSVNVFEYTDKYRLVKWNY